MNVVNERPAMFDELTEICLQAFREKKAVPATRLLMRLMDHKQVPSHSPRLLRLLRRLQRRRGHRHLSEHFHRQHELFLYYYLLIRHLARLRQYLCLLHIQV